MICPICKTEFNPKGKGRRVYCGFICRLKAEREQKKKYKATHKPIHFPIEYAFWHAYGKFPTLRELKQYKIYYKVKQTLQ